VSEDARHRWIMDEIPAVRRHLAGPSGLACAVILTAYEDSVRPPTRDTRPDRGRGRPPANLPPPPDPRAWLDGAGRQLYRAMQKDRS